MTNNIPMSPVIPAMTKTVHHLLCQQRCARGVMPQGEGDILLLYGKDEAAPLYLFVPVRNMAERVFAPDAPPDSVLMKRELRHALLAQYLEMHGLELSGSAWNASQIRLATQAEVAAANLTDWCYDVPSSFGPVALCLDNNPGINIPTTPQRHHRGNYPAWHLPLQCRVGWTAMPLSQLRELETGDLVMLTRRQQYLTLTGRYFGQWKFDEKGIVMERMDPDEDWMFEDDDEDIADDEDDDEYDGDDDELSLEAQGADDVELGLRDIEMTLEVTLGKAGLLLSQAMALQAGDFVPLTSGGLKASRLRLGNQTLAKGELVEVDGRLGLILNHIYFRAAGQP